MISKLGSKRSSPECRRSPSSPLRFATRYRVGSRSRVIATTAALEIDNNIAERALRAVALGRKNYLFAGSDAGGEHAAALYSLIGTAKLNDIDPEAYLRQVLDTHRRASHQSGRRASALGHFD